MKTNWDKRFMDLAEHYAKWSKDRNTGVGAVIVDINYRQLSMGYNGFPSGLNDDIDSRHKRPIKYLYTEHAERNSIYSAAQLGISLKNTTIYSTLFPCADCARAIIQSGITTLVSKKPDLEHKTWGDSFKIAIEMFIECNVEIKYID